MKCHSFVTLGELLRSSSYIMIPARTSRLLLECFCWNVSGRFLLSRCSQSSSALSPAASCLGDTRARVMIGGAFVFKCTFAMSVGSCSCMHLCSHAVTTRRSIESRSGAAAGSRCDAAVAATLAFCSGKSFCACLDRDRSYCVQ